MNAGITPLVVGVTSHRNIPAGEVDSIRHRVRDLLVQFQKQFPHLPLVVLSALAEGGDQLVAQEGLECGARLIAPLPLPREMYAQDFTDPGTRAAFDSLCARAQVIQLPLLPGHTLIDIAQSGVERNRQYAQAGAFVARRRCSTWPPISSGGRASFPAASASAWLSAAPSCASRPCFCSMSRSPTSMPICACRCAPRSCASTAP